MSLYADIAAAARRVGLLARGGFHVTPDDGLPDAATVVMIGNAGGDLWRVFPHSPEAADGAPHALDRWSRRVIGALAAQAGGRAIFPFDGPPYAPFQRWAQRADSVYPSPVGMLIHPDYGLWHAYRGAVALPSAIQLPPAGDRPRPCDSCSEKPCLTGCPVAAFTAAGYDVAACAGHLNDDAGIDCMAGGCLARRACPAGREYLYDRGQAAWHMHAFRRAVSGNGERKDEG